MYFSTISSSLILLSACQQTLASSCTSFTPQDPDYSSVYRTYPVSKGLVCQAGGPQCTIQSGGYVTAERTLNITTDSADSIFDLISTTLNTHFNESITGSVENFTETFNASTYGYISFTPYTHCSSGVLDGCEGDIANGTLVAACTPITLSAGTPNGFPVLNGVVAFVNTDEATASNLTCNRANTTAARNGINPTNCTEAATEQTGQTSQTNGASLNGYSSALFTAVLGAIVFVF